MDHDGVLFDLKLNSARLKKIGVLLDRFKIIDVAAPNGVPKCEAHRFDRGRCQIAAAAQIWGQRRTRGRPPPPPPPTAPLARDLAPRCSGTPP